MDLHGGNIYKIEKQYNIPREEIIDFSSNINPIGISPKLKEEIFNNLDVIQNYPDPNYLELKSALAEYNNIQTENIVPGNGATELIYLYSRVLKPKTALIISPTFAEYNLALHLTDTRISFFKLNEEEGFKINLNELKNELNKAYDLLIICNPNNPTGIFLNPDEIEEIIHYLLKCESSIFIDESFIEFIENGLNKSSLKTRVNTKNIFILRSLTKFFAIPGLRLGYAICPDFSLAATIKNKQEPWTVNLIADIAARTLLRDRVYIENTVKLINDEKIFLHDKIEKISWLKAYEPSANFILVKILNNLSSSELKAILIKEKILIRDASNFKFLNNKFIRLAVKDRKSNNHLIDSLNSINI